MITNDNKIAAIIGATTGLIRFFSSLTEGVFLDRLIQACIIAFCSAFIGIIGKYIAEYILRKIKKIFL
jgi:hypothetical protein